MLVLDGAPLDRTATGALWAAFAGGGRHRAAVGRLVVVPSVAEPLIAAVVAGAERLRPGNPREAETEVGPLRSAETRERVEELVAAAVADGATLLCGGPRSVPGVTGAFYAPAVLRGVPPDARLLREPVPGPVLAVVEAGNEEDAIALATGSPAVSVWGGDRARGERVARTLGAEVAWVNEHGHSIPSAAVRLAGHVDSHRLASQPTRLRSARWLPYDPALVRASTDDRAALARPRERAPRRAADGRRAARAHRGAARARSARPLRSANVNGGWVGRRGRRGGRMSSRSPGGSADIVAVRRRYAAARRARGVTRSRSGSSGTTTRFTYSAPPCSATERAGSHERP